MIDVSGQLTSFTRTACLSNFVSLVLWSSDDPRPVLGCNLILGSGYVAEKDCPTVRYKFRSAFNRLSWKSAGTYN